MIILIDCDDTIWNLCDAWVKWLNSHYGTSVDIKDINEWDMKKSFPELTELEIYDCLKNEMFWLTVKPKQDALQYVPLIEELGHTIYFVTSTNPHNVLFKARMLADWFPKIPHDRLIITYHKELIKGDFLIDDYIENFKGNRCGILFDANHNQNIEIDGREIKRFDNWKDIYDYISGYLS